MNGADRNSRVGSDLDESLKAKVAEKLEDAIPPNSDAGLSTSKTSIVTRWFLHDIPFVAMLLLALVGVTFRLPTSYWLILMPVFGIISIVEGWRQFTTWGDRVRLVTSVAAIWCALLLAIYLLYSNGVQGILTSNGTSLAMMPLLALGTFVAGIQSRVWQICAVGGVLFLAAPGLGWFEQSPLLLLAMTCMIIVLGGLAWWFIDGGRSKPASEAPSR